MATKQLISLVLILAMTVLPVSVNADTYVIPFSDIRQAVNNSNDSPDTVIYDYLAGQIRDELDALGLNVDGGLVFGEIPLDEITETIRTDCDFLRPYEIHTDATTATINIDDSSSLTFGLDSIRSINILANLTGTIETATTAWVRWGQDIIFVGDCVKINTDHGWLGLTLPFQISLDLTLNLNPSYDDDLVAIVVDKHAVLFGQAQFNGGNLQHDFGTGSLTDLVISAFEDELLQELRTNGEQVVADAVAALNYRLDGLDENGVPDPTIVAFNGPTTFVVEESEEDKEFVRDLLQQFGIPDLVISMLDDRGIEILLQLAILEGAEREAYLASLGASVSCDALLGTSEVQLASVPIYAVNGQSCEVADVRGPDAGAYFTDMLCTNELAFSVTDAAEYCRTRFDDQAEALLGNAAAWAADTNQPNDPLPEISSRSWTTVPGTQLDLGVVPLQGNHQPYMKQVNYKTIDVPRGNGTCELEMRVYKSDIIERDLKSLMALHGGTWRHRGFSFLGLEAGVSHLTERGFIVFAPFYRLVGESDGNVECNAVTWREVTEDVESALDWINENGAALGAANGPVSVFGQSAGAHLAAWLAAHRSADVRKALLYYAPTDALEFLSGAVPIGGPYDDFRRFGLDALSRFYGAHDGANELRFERIDFSGLTVTALSVDWSILIPDSVFDISQIDPQNAPLYVARCATATQIDLSAINLSMPPVALTQCMKQDLAEFLIDNSFNHLLGSENVPIHVVHGSADTLVPYQQAINLCGAIDKRVFSTDVVGPLTAYACGAESQVQIIQDADHALELGLCLGSICPAGEFGSVTRGAVATAIENSYLWLLEDRPLVNTIEITRAWWYEAYDKLAVWANSDLGSEADLEMTAHLDGGGTVTWPLIWNTSKNRWQINVHGFIQQYGSPTTVTVNGAEGSDSAQVIYKYKK
jgi:acetyl esterase/lipase